MKKWLQPITQKSIMKMVRKPMPRPSLVIVDKKRKTKRLRGKVELDNY